MINYKTSLYLLLSMIFFSVIMQGCSSGNIPVKELIPVDSLGWQEVDDYTFVFPFDLKSSSNELFVVDNGASQVFVFDINSLEYIRTIGSKGSGPGELMGPQSIGIYGQDSLIVLDAGNFRLQYFNRSGEFKRSVPEFGLWTISQFESEIYANKYSLLPDTGIYKIEQDSVKIIYPLTEWFKDQSLNSVEENFYSLGILRNHFVVSFVFNSQIVLIDIQDGFLETAFNIPDRGYSQQSLGKPLAYKEGFLLPVTNSNNSIDEQISMTELIYYDLSGKIVEVFRIPGTKTFFIEGMLLDKDYVYAFDALAAILYKYKLP